MYKQIICGKVEYYKLRRDGAAHLINRCCDCGLTHYETYKPIKGRIAIRVWVDRKYTKQARRTKHYRKARNWRVE